MLIIEQLVEQNQRQQEEINLLKNEINRLKGQKKRPKFKPSKLDESTDKQAHEEVQDNKKRRARSKGTKTST